MWYVQLKIQVQVASSIPVWRWGGLKLRHRTVLADWGVKATHFLKQKATLQHSWQHMNSGHYLMYHVHRVIMFFPSRWPTVSTFIQLSPSSLYYTWRNIDFLRLFLSSYNSNWVSEILQLQCFWPQKRQFWSVYSIKKKKSMDLVTIQLSLTQHLPYTWQNKQAVTAFLQYI